MGILRFEDGTGIQVPDGATPEQVEAILAERKRQQELADIRERARISYSAMPTSQRLRLGYTRPFVEVGLGIKDFAGKVGIGSGLSFEDEAKLAQLEQVHGGAGTAARVGGELVTFAAPGGASQKMTTNAPRAIKALADIGTSAGVEALKAPTDTQSRADRALSGAFGAAAGHTLLPLTGRLLRNVTGGVRATPEAQAMLDAGIPLTPGMARGGTLQQIEQHLANLPIVGPAVRARQQDALNAWNKNLLNEVTPGASVTEVGQAGMRQLTQKFSDAYEALWNRTIKFKNGLTAPGKRVEALDDQLRKDAQAAFRRGDNEAAERFASNRQQLRALLPDDVAAELTRLDNLYVNFATLRRASSYVGAAKQGGVFTPGQVLQAAVARRGAQAAQGRAPLQPQAQRALDILTPPRPRAPGMLEKAVVGTASLPVTVPARLAYGEPMNRWLTGQTTIQQYADELLGREPVQYTIDALRRTSRPAYVGAALEE